MPKQINYSSSKRTDMLSRDQVIDFMFDLINAFRLVKTPMETAYLIQDLLTSNEIKNLAKRLRVAKLLLAGETQRDITQEVHCSIATVTKVNVWLNEGGKGLKEVIAKLPRKYKIPKKLPPIPLEFQLPRLLLTVAQYLAAAPQDKLVKNFIKDVEHKKIIDKQLQEEFNSQYRGKIRRKTIVY